MTKCLPTTSQIYERTNHNNPGLSEKYFVDGMYHIILTRGETSKSEIKSVQKRQGWFEYMSIRQYN